MNGSISCHYILFIAKYKKGWSKFASPAINPNYLITKSFWSPLDCPLKRCVDDDPCLHGTPIFTYSWQFEVLCVLATLSRHNSTLVVVDDDLLWTTKAILLQLLLLLLLFLVHLFPGQQFNHNVNHLMSWELESVFGRTFVYLLPKGNYS